LYLTDYISFLVFVLARGPFVCELLVGFVLLKEKFYGKGRRIFGMTVFLRKSIRGELKVVFKIDIYFELFAIFRLI
jgi:hypothetical protein